MRTHLVVALLVAAPTALRPQSDPARIPGVILPTQYNADEQSVDIGGGKVASPAQVATMKRTLGELAALINTMPHFAKPVGFSSQASYTMQVGSSNFWRGERVTPIEGRVDFSTWMHHTGPDGKLRVVKTPIREDDYTGSGVSLTVNSMGCILREEAMMSDSIGGMWGMPVEDKNEYGFQRYPHCIAVTSRKAPLFVAIGRERVLRVLMTQLDLRIKATEQWQKVAAASDRAAYNEELKAHRARQTMLKRALASMTAAERKAPAIVLHSYFADPASEAVWADANDPTALRLVEPNPQFFDTTRLGDVQLITVERLEVGDPEVAKLMHSQFDWKALAAKAK